MVAISLIKASQAEIIGLNLSAIRDYIFFTLQKNTWTSKLDTLLQSGTDRHSGNSDQLRVSEGCLNKFPPRLNYYSLVLYILSKHTQRDAHLLSFSHNLTHAEY